ncbi:MAG: DUF368 domain-containing protein [Coprobacillaceae bacterium]
MLLNFIRGFCMAMADSVPGVSGGTIAFLLGFYDDFISSLDNLISGSKEERKTAIIFLLKLGVGWIIGFLGCVVLLASIFDSEIYNISSLFIGFIIFAIPIVVMEEKHEILGKYKNIIFLIIGVAVVFLISYFNPSSGEGSSISPSNINIGTGIYIFVVGMVAISAMVLPGISGSTILLIFGLYVPIITGIKELIKFNFDYLPMIVIAGLGIVTGILSTIKIIRWALKKYRSQTIYLIIGLMIGSLYAIVLGPTTLEVPQEALSFNTFSIPFFVIGGVVILGLQKFKQVTEKN